MSPRIGLCVSDATILPKSYKIVTLIASERVVQGILVNLGNYSS